MRNETVEITVRVSPQELELFAEQAIRQWPDIQVMRGNPIGIVALYLPSLASQKQEERYEKIKAEVEGRVEVDYKAEYEKLVKHFTPFVITHSFMTPPDWIVETSSDFPSVTTLLGKAEDSPQCRCVTQEEEIETVIVGAQRSAKEF